MNEEFINVYIEIMNKKIEELTRNDIMAQARLNLAEKIINGLKTENEKGQKAYAELQEAFEQYRQQNSTVLADIDKPSKNFRPKTNKDAFAVTNDGGEV